MDKLNNVKEQAGDLLLVAAMASLLVSIRLTNVFVGLLIISWIIFTGPKEIVRRLKGRLFPVLICVAPFLFMLISLIWSGDPAAGWHNMEKYLLLLIFPLMMATKSFMRKSDFFVFAFAAVITAACTVCFIFGVYRFFFIDEALLPLVGDFYTSVPSKWNALSNTNLVMPFSISPIYLSLFVTFSIFVIAIREQMTLRYRIGIIFFLVVFEILLGSRIGLLALGFVAIIFLVRMPGGQRTSYWVAAAAGFVIIVVAMFVNPVLYKRYKNDVGAIEIPTDVSGWNALNLRRAIWSCSEKIFEESPVLGHGIGSQNAGREKCYKAYSFYGVFGTDFNSHNQYIEYALIGGIILLGLFVAQLTFSFLRSIQNKNPAHFAFLLTFAIVCVGESCLETNKGIVFFSCFNAIFIFISPIRTENV